jgi:GNAT superfamily N-acetyltransferase
MNKNLGDFGDPKEEISKSIDYAFSDEAGKGGFVLALADGERLLGGLIMNKTGMAGYIPENILVYVAVDENSRGLGFGSKIIEKAHELSEGNIALHVEYDNPAKRLYERLGYTSKYAEMRFKKSVT